MTHEFERTGNKTNLTYLEELYTQSSGVIKETDEDPEIAEQGTGEFNH
jgi:hypothetical protein